MLNVAILAAGVGLLNSAVVPLGVSMVFFGVGTASGAMSIFATDVQKGYYRNARDLKKKFEDELELGDWALATTPSMAAMRERFARVTTFQIAILVALVTADLVGLGVSIQHALGSRPTPVEAAFSVVLTGSHLSVNVPVVFTREGNIAAAIAPVPGAITMIRLDPGSYEISALVGKSCTSVQTVSSQPLQRVVLTCKSPAQKRAKRRAARRRRHGR